MLSFLVIVCITHLCVELCGMPGRRSYFAAVGLLSEAQLKRKECDAHYTTSRSAVGKRLVEVNSNVAAAVKSMAKGKALHAEKIRLWDSSPCQACI